MTKKLTWSVPVKFGLLSLGISLIGMLGISSLIYSNSSELLEQQALNRLHDDLQREESMLLNNVKTLHEDLGLLSRDSAIHGIIRAQKSEGYDERENMTFAMWQERLTTLTGTMLKQRPSYLAIQLQPIATEQATLLDIERQGGIVLSRQNETRQLNRFDTRYPDDLSTVVSDRIRFTTPRLLKQNGRIIFPPQSVVYASQAIRDQRGAIYAVLTVQIDFDQMFSARDHSNSNINYFATDLEGHYFTHPNIEKNWAYELYPDQHLSNDIPELVDAGLFRLSQNEPELSIRSGDEGVVLRYVQLTDFGFKDNILLGAETDLDYLHQESAGLLKTISILMLFGGFLLAIATTIIAYGLTRPLQRLKLAADEVSAGNINADIPITGDDEVASLGRSMQAMLEHLKRSHQDLEEVNDSLEMKVEQRTSELELALKQAKAAAIAKAQFLATMSHEIRTPLNGVLGMTELLLSTPLNMLQRNHLETVKRSGETLLNLLNDILDLSKIEAGKLSINITDFNPNELLENCVMLFADTANQKGLDVIPVTLPKLPQMLKGDPDRISQVLMNLVNNAIKFTDKGEVVVKLDTLLEDHQKIVLRFSVADTGIGISNEAQARLFQKFVQLDSTSTRKYGGTGLGLAISRQLVELMGGEIKLNSIEGAGTKIWFDLTFEKGKKALDLTAEYRELLQQTSTLIVDDNSTNRELLQHIVVSWGMSSGSEASAEDALVRLLRRAQEGNPYQLVLLDQMMPDIDGLGLAKMIQQQPTLAGLKLIMLSSMDLPDQNELNALNIHTYLRKPFRQSELYNAIIHTMNDECLDSVSTPSSHNPIDVNDALAARIGAKILLAEDTPVNQQVTLGMLKQLGFSATLAEDGAQAFAEYQKELYDLVLMDIQMPIMDGYEATSSIRALEMKLGRHTPIVALTAHAMNGDRELCLEKGMDDHLAKPLAKQALIEALIRWLPVHQGVSSIETADKQPAPVEYLAPATSQAQEKVEVNSEAKVEVEAVVNNAEASALATSEPRSEANHEAYNIKVLRQLYNDLGHMSLKPLLTTFDSSLPELFQQLESSIANQQSDQVKKTSHRIKGSARSLGAITLGQQAEQMEHCALDNDYQGMALKLVEIRQSIDALHQALSSPEITELCHE
ncbi:Signal transduction histidine kinase [Oceanospirillum multiglobuliferum]|uniref:hybrid sensor histidine kinase/response regulator n=1 Tax=Oceanospirillum multiglobuliferum TaxID=64969 RepID=UPI00099B0F91|nr:response regulator [Oceanospirillum multiglobuliferum]SJZ86724.1 Signal transduction histidine kinase [Oceanospirillum multiglobuliferum]